MAFPSFIRNYPMPEKFDGELNLVDWRLDKDEGQHQPEDNINDIALLLITYLLSMHNAAVYKSTS